MKDDKTTGSSIGNHWSEEWDLRSQFIGYTWAAKRGHPRLQGSRARHLPFKIKRSSTSKNDKVTPTTFVERWLQKTVRRNLISMVKAHDEGYFEFNLADACTQYGNCIFMDRCGVPTPTHGIRSTRSASGTHSRKNPIGLTPKKEAA